eukprot:c9964_g1_i1.p1 GENE.c9964_g1_i1~~c9964_g1_i1.p1  ORF type:complete len:1731 (-),score=431.55 c9964_g1_i1:75-5267(-)
MSNLCVGRTKTCADVVSRYFPYELCYAIVTDERLQGNQLTIRAAFLKILRSVYIDRDPYMDLSGINLTRVWGKFNPDVPKVSVTIGIDFQPLKSFLMNWVIHSKRQKQSEEAKNQMTAVVLSVLADCLRFGFFESVKELSEVIYPLMQCLDGRDEELGDDENKNRYASNAKNLPIMDCKREILRIFDIIASLRANYRLGSLLSVFQNRLTSSRYDSELEEKTKQMRKSRTMAVLGSVFSTTAKGASALSRFGSKISAAIRSNSATNDQDRDLLEVFEPLQLSGSVDRQAEAVEVFLDCTKYDNLAMVQEAFRTLIRNFNQFNIMLSSLKNTQLLVSEASEMVYNRVKENCEVISRLMSPKMTSEEEKITLARMLDLEKLALNENGTPNATNQQILRSAGAHELAHRMLRLPFSNQLPAEQGRRDIFLSCYRLLKNFVLKNSQNQTILLKHVEFYMSQMGVKLKAADTLTEIFRDNRQVCSQIEEKTIRHFVTIISERGQFPRYLQFFRIIIMPEGRPLKRNQDLILKLMLEKEDKVMVLYNDREGRQLRRKLINDQDHIKNEEGALNYHLVLLQLLGDIVSGHNHLAELKCQALLPIDLCRDHINERDLPPFVKWRWLAFVREAYLETERVLDLASLGNALWDIVENIAATFVASSEDEAYVAEVGRFIASLYSKITSAKDSDPAAVKATVAVATTLSAAYKAGNLKNNRELVAKALLAIKQLRIGDRELSGVLPTALDTRSVVTEQKVVVRPTEESKSELRVKKAFNLFMQEYAKSMGLTQESASAEYLQLVQIFLDDNPKVTANLPSTLLEPALHAWGPQNVNTMKLITLLHSLSGEAEMKRMGLRVLSDLATYEDEELEITREMSQNRLDKLGEYSHKKYKGKTFGATTLMLDMLTDKKHEDVTKEVLILGCNLLLDGNKKVQDRIYNYFLEDSAGLFFEHIRDWIRRGCDEIKERKAYNQRVLEILEASDGLDIDEIRESLPPYIERTHIVHLFRFIQLTCEGHNHKLQDYWRNQHHSVRSHDIVTEISNYLVELSSSGVTVDNIDQTIQCIETLTELMQGPCKGNQVALASSKLPSICNKILLLKDFPGCEDKQWMQLHESTAITLLALLEGCRDKAVPVNIANEFDFENLFNILEESQDALTAPATSSDEENEDAVDKLEMAFAIVCFLMTIREYVPDVRKKMEENMDIIEPYYKETGRIEINHDGDLERVFFRIPSICHNLTERSKYFVLWQVDRSSPGKKVEDFVRYADDLEAEMRHQETLKHNATFLKLSKFNFDARGTTIAFWLALFINMIMFFHYTLPQDSELQAALRARRDGCDAELDPQEGGCPDVNLDRYQAYLAPGWFALIIILGLVLTAVEGVRFGLFVSQFAKLIVLKGFKTRGLNMQWEEWSTASKFEKVRTVLWTVYFLLHSTKFVSALLLFVFGLLGLFASPLFFSVHLLNTVEMSIDLKNVLRAVTLNGKSLAITSIFGVMIVYLFAIWGFLAFRNHYETDDGDLLCLNLMQCTITTLNGGLRKGDVGEVMKDTEWGNPPFIAFQFAYFAVVITILLNIIFGIIIDTFGELRQIKADTEDDIANKCFVCSIDRYTIDRYTQGGFAAHILDDHNMWQYVFFMVHLNVKDENNYTGAESFVKSLIKAQDASWFPVNQAIKLSEHMAQQERAQTELRSVVNETATRTGELDKKLEKLLNQTTNNAEMIAALLARGGVNNARPANEAQDIGRV